MAEQFSIPTVGDVIAGKYRVVEELGRGAYGVVFRAEQEELGRSVAVKTLLPQAFLQQDIVQRFHREAQLISRLDHPNIIRLWDYGVDEGLLYMAVEYVEGRTLMDVIENDAPLAPARVLQLALQILDALEHAHKSGIVHRDLKPDNVVLLETKTSDGQQYEVVKILDFGISKLLRGENELGALKSLTQDGTVLGTPHYMSPENIVGDPIDHRADLYAVGVILYEMLTGVHPFDAPSPSAVMVRHLRDPAPPIPEPVAGTPLGLAIERCLEKQPWDRVDSARALIELLETQEGDLPTLPRPQSGRRSPATLGAPIALPDTNPDVTDVSKPDIVRSTYRNPAVLAAGALIVSVLAVSIGWKVRLATHATDPSDTPVAEAGELPVAQPVVALTPPETKPEPPPATAPDVGSSGPAMVFGETADVGTVEASPEPEPTDPPREADEPRKPVRVQRRTRPDPPVDAEKERAMEKIEIDFTSVPTNASVTIDGVPVGSTPLRRQLVAGKAIEVRFSHIGYKEKVVTMTPSGEQRSVRANLEKDHLRLID